MRGGHRPNKSGNRKMNAANTRLARSRSRHPPTVPEAIGPTARLDADAHDFDQLALVLSGWDASFRQLSGGAFAGRIEFVRQGALDAFRLRCNRAIQARGIQRRARCTISL